MATWIDFKTLKAQLKILDVLNHHSIKVRIRGEQASGFCPLPGHVDSKSPSFSAHLGRNCFNCFGCQRHGSAIDLELFLRGLDPADTKAVRKVALELIERHGLALDSHAKRTSHPPQSPTTRQGNRRRATRYVHQNAAVESTCDSERQLADGVDDDRADPDAIINPPLAFVLQQLDPAHPYLSDRGFTASTIEHFGLGFCSKGMLKDRIAIPLHNLTGNLVGYAGRTVDDAAISPEHPKYLFPGRRQKGKQVIAFRKSTLLYNAHRIETPAKSLVIVEGFPSVWWLHQHGIKNAVALMGAAASPWQIQQIATATAERGKLFAFPDGDDAGVRLARELLPQLAARRWTTWVKLLADEQPTDLDGEMLNALLVP